MKTILFFIFSILAVSFSGCQNSKTKNTDTKKETVVKVEAQATPAKDTTQTPKATLHIVDPVIKEAPEYFLIGGCFRIKDNADRMHETLHKEGYANALIMPYCKDLYLVAYDGYKTHEEAVSAVRKIHKVPGKEETWIYQLK